MFDIFVLSSDPHPVYSNMNHNVVMRAGIIFGIILLGVFLFLLIQPFVRQMWGKLLVALVIACAIFLAIRNIHSVMHVFHF